MNILIGPYIGGLEQALFTFRPHAAWLYNCLRVYCSDFYISTHEDHRFMYDWPETTFVPVADKLGDDNVHQGIMNTMVSNKDYISITKQLRTIIGNNDTIHCYARYTKYDNFTIPISKKLFTRINSFDINHSNEILMISREDKLGIVEKLIDKIEGAIEICSIESTSPKELIHRILSARLVICPCGVWTYFCNLHGIPVVSWGESLGLYKDGGPYYFNNKNAYILYHSNGDTDIHRIMAGINYILERLYNVSDL